MKFDIIKYLSGLTGFVFSRSVLERIAYDRGVGKVESYEELEQQTKDLLLADLLYVAYNSPDIMASSSRSHGAYSQSVGSQTINDKDRIYNTMISIYKKYGEDEKIELILDTSSNLQWLE